MYDWKPGGLSRGPINGFTSLKAKGSQSLGMNAILKLKAGAFVDSAKKPDAVAKLKAPKQ